MGKETPTNSDKNEGAGQSNPETKPVAGKANEGNRANTLPKPTEQMAETVGSNDRDQKRTYKEKIEQREEYRESLLHVYFTIGLGLVLLITGILIVISGIIQVREEIIKGVPPSTSSIIFGGFVLATGFALRKYANKFKKILEEHNDELIKEQQ